jgi:hypothetical protein
VAGEIKPPARAARQAWPMAVRERAEELARDRLMPAAEVKRALSEELGASVPLDTVARWVKELRRREPLDRSAVLRDVADRASLLLSAELDRLERQPAKTRDLGRLDAAVKTLKTLSAVEPSKAGNGRQTLADVAKDEPRDERSEASMHGTEPKRTTVRTAA